MIRSPNSGKPARRGFTLVEALVAISIMALAGSVLILSAQTSLDSSDDSVNQAIAQGIVSQVLDEIMTKRYMESGQAYNVNVLHHENTETSRSDYDDTDDYNGYVTNPPQDPWGQSLGAGDDAGGLRHPNFQVPDTFFKNWRVQVDVYYVNENDLATRLDSPPVVAGQTVAATSGCRAAEVSVQYLDADGTVRTLATGRLVFAYVPAPP